MALSQEELLQLSIKNLVEENKRLREALIEIRAESRPKNFYYGGSTVAIYSLADRALEFKELGCE